MKKLQAIMLGATLVGANPVHALINDSKFGDPGELFVSVYDADAKKSYYKDLGISMGAFVKNPASAVFDLSADPNFSALIGRPNLVYNVGAVTELLKDESNMTTWGYLATSSEGPSIFNADWSAVDNALQKIQSYIVYLNPEGFNNAPGQADENLSGTYLPVDQGYHGADTWGPRMDQSVGGNTEGTVGKDVEFYFVGNSTGDAAGKQVVKLGVWNLSASGQLSFVGTGGPVTVTPKPVVTPTVTRVPTALDLLGSLQWIAKQKGTITWRADFSKVKKGAAVTFKFNKGDGKFKSIGAAKYAKGQFQWKPTKKQVTDNGVIQGCVKPSVKNAPLLCSTLNVVVRATP